MNSVTWAQFGEEETPPPDWYDQEAPAEITNPIADRFRSNLFTIEQLRGLPGTVSVIDGVLDENRLTIIHGPPKSGKSFITLAWALSVTTGTWWLGKHTTIPSTVLYVAAEGSVGLPKRVDAWLTANNVQDPGNLHVERSSVNLTSPADVGGFCAMAIGLAPKLIVIDTLARCMVGADENSAKDIGVVINHLEQIRETTGASVVAVHHSGRSGSNMRGSSALDGAVDMAYSVAKDERTVNLERTMAKDGPDGVRWRLSLIPTGKSLALGKFVPQPVDEISAGAMALLQVLAEIDPNGQTVTRSEWKESCPTEVPDRMFGRAIGGLVRWGFVQQSKVGNGLRYLITQSGRVALATDTGHLPLDEESHDPEPF